MFERLLQNLEEKGRAKLNEVADTFSRLPLLIENIYTRFLSVKHVSLNQVYM